VVEEDGVAGELLCLYTSDPDVGTQLSDFVHPTLCKTITEVTRNIFPNAIVISEF
jgi:hypothetical protein